MTDVLTPAQRSRCMAAILSKNTQPEIAVRRLLTTLGVRYRLHQKKLPGKPDIVIPKLRKAIFVHGCFWHRHHCRYGMVTPQTNSDFWQRKLLGNVSRDRENRLKLRRLKWKCLVIWECEVRKPVTLARKIGRFLAIPDIASK